MKRISLILLVAVFATTSCSVNCITGSGNAITQDYDATNFESIKIGGSYDLILTQDSIYSVTLTGDDNIIDRMEVEVNNGTLQIKSKDQFCFNFKNKMILAVSAPSIQSLDISGSANITATNAIQTENFKINSSGSTKMDLDLIANDVETTISGSGNISLRGSANNMRIKISGSGKMQAKDFVVNTCKVSNSGSADLVLHVTGNLDVSSSGSSKVRYLGFPASVTQSISGSGSVKPLENQ